MTNVDTTPSIERHDVDSARATSSAVDRLAVRPAEPRERITMLLENNDYPQDPRVRREAESLVAAGHFVEVIAPREEGEPARETINGVRVRRFRSVNPTRSGAAPIALEYGIASIALHVAALRGLLRGSTVLHLHNPPDILFAAGAMFRAAGREVIFDHHDLGPELSRVRFGPGLLERVARWSERLTFAVATHVLAANESHAEIARDRGRMRRADVTVVRNGPPARWTRLPVRTRPGTLAPIRLAYLGAIAHQDGVDGLAEILACLHRRHPEVEAVLTVIGDGDARQDFEAAVARCGVSESVTVTGWVDGARVPELLQEADVCLDPSPSTVLNERSTMIKVTEYLALGKPVVSYDLLETRRSAGDAAVFVAPGDAEAFADAIAQLAGDAELRTDLAHRARERARDLTWERSEQALLAAYAGLRQSDDGRK
ncbi:MAG TPA: glycosyltransferase family 4 protein [Solirubrobacteraceae bacterium]|nr:glycosyltransferase family 4 protein [Solirubrobacteraceae bacterium]